MIEEFFCFKCGLPDTTANMETLHVPDGDGGFYSIEFHAHPVCQGRQQGLNENYNAARLIVALHKLIDEIEVRAKNPRMAISGAPGCLAQQSRRVTIERPAKRCRSPDR
jgi:hypothetical protein